VCRGGISFDTLMNEINLSRVKRRKNELKYDPANCALALCTTHDSGEIKTTESMQLERDRFYTICYGSFRRSF
jgi:hypothetical protein